MPSFSSLPRALLVRSVCLSAHSGLSVPSRIYLMDTSLMSLVKQAAQPHTLQPSHAAGCIARVRFPRTRENSKPQHHRLGSSLNQVGNELLGAPATVDCFAPDLGEPWVHDDRDPHSIFASRPRTGECCSRVGEGETGKIPRKHSQRRGRLSRGRVYTGNVAPGDAFRDLS